MELTEKQQQFVIEYLIDLNATAAYLRAGYKSSKEAAAVGAFRLLRNAKIQEAIQACRQKAIRRLQLTADQIIDEVKNIAYSDVGDILDFTGEEARLKPAKEISPAARRTISSVKVKRYVEGKGDDARTVEVTEFRLWDKVAALGRLCNHLGIGTESESGTGDTIHFHFGEQKVLEMRLPTNGSPPQQTAPALSSETERVS